MWFEILLVSVAGLMFVGALVLAFFVIRDLWF